MTLLQAAKAALTGDGLVGRPAASSPTAAAPASGPSPADPSPAAPEVCAPLTTFYREKLQRLVCSEPAMLFIKGTLRNPKCGEWWWCVMVVCDEWWCCEVRSGAMQSRV